MIKKEGSNTLTLTQPLRDVRLRTGRSPEVDPEQRVRECEQAAFERGRREGEQVLSNSTAVAMVLGEVPIIGHAEAAGAYHLSVLSTKMPRSNALPASQ